jgi:hypothetical protein
MTFVKVGHFETIGTTAQNINRINNILFLHVKF